MSKCECKNCVHEKVCRTREFPSIEEILKDGCPHYKSKSLCVELPCAIGQKVYVIEVCHCYNDIYANECHIRRTKASKYIERRCLPYKHHTRCAKLYERAFKIEHLSKLGKTVFLTKEDAEQKINEINNTK